ncbi:CLK4-associating serine/arginine rich protein [Fasciola gigantica]|uniref:CLK4-associating serine/arginine rich protein n=1 Tax=Fasciola gigantica TaxID=46835 RepID=A0A504YV12_FASGI|nr:CLK4-associating serine/arginine rich protein [Fasciola gigantica]
MWQEARKQEKHIKTLMVDYKRRAERRRDYYERIKQDPIKFLRVYGRPAKLHLDSEVVKAAENPNIMMPWTGDPSILIDRFDARTNLEHYNGQTPDDLKLNSVERIEERLCMYERYRCLIHNDYAGVTEAMALKQIDLDEKYGDLDRKRKEEEEISKRSQEPKAAIGFTYEDSHPPLPPTGASLATPTCVTSTSILEDSDSDEKADSDMDIDVELDLTTLSVDGRRQLAKSAYNFGLHATDFLRLLDADQQLETELRLAKALEEEKLQLAGRKSRRARRILRERRAPDKFPKMLGIKVGLLNGQPISRRTVYLSASSSDSGEYPSDVDDEPDDFDASLSPNSKAAALREQRAKAKPILTTARGPSVMIGGMTSIGLCRRKRTQHPVFGLRSGSLSSSSSSSSTASDRRHRGRGGAFRGCQHPSRVSSHRRSKRSRVEYITTFGDQDDDDDDDDDDKKKAIRNSSLSAPPWQTDKPPGTAATAVAASVVSKLLGSERKHRSPDTLATIRPSAASRDPLRGPEPMPTSFRSHQQPRGGRGSFRRSSPLDGYRLRVSSSSSASRSRTHSRSTSSRSKSPQSRRGKSSYSRRGASGGHLRRSMTRRRTGSSRDSASRNARRRDDTGSTHRHRPSFGRSSSSSAGPSRHSVSRFTRSRSNRSHTSRSITRSRSPSPIRSLSSSSSHAPVNREPTPPIRRRYYRPELESDENSGLSGYADDGSEDDTGAHNDSLNRKPTHSDRPMDTHRYRRTSDSHNIAGKMTTTAESNSGDHNSSSVIKPTTSNSGICGAGLGTPRLTPQELLKRRVQTQLTKAFNADKKAELEKQVQLEQERQAREEGLRRQALLLRRQEEKRQREERRAAIRAAGGNVNDSDSSSSSSSKASLPRSRRSAGYRRDSPPSPRSRDNVSHTGSSPTSPRKMNTNTRARRRSPSPGFRSPYRSGRLPSPPPSASSQLPRTGGSRGGGGGSHSASRDFAPKVHPVRDIPWSGR